LLLAKLTEKVVTTIRSRARAAELTIYKSLALRKGMNVSGLQSYALSGRPLPLIHFSRGSSTGSEDCG